MRTQRNEICHRSPSQVSQPLIGFDDFENYQDLARLGICFDHAQVAQMAGHLGMDADLTPGITDPSITTPVQFLQEWLPGIVHILTAARRIDELVGITTQGSWEDEEIVQSVLERTGSPMPYGDYNDIPLSSWNLNFERRTIVRFEEGVRVGVLESKRASRMQIDTAAEKRGATAESLEILRNRIGFFGYNGGANRTYGFLNDPNLPAYVTVADPGSGTEWENKTFLEICADVRSWVSALRTQSKDRVDPDRDEMIMAIATSVVDQLSTTSDFGVSVWEWMKENYPKIRVISAPELDQANGAENVAYLYAVSVGGDGSSDDRRTFVQAVPTKMQTLGVEQNSKYYVEDYSNATAGVMVKRPFAIFRATGI